MYVNKNNNSCYTCIYEGQPKRSLLHAMSFVEDQIRSHLSCLCRFVSMFDSGLAGVYWKDLQQVDWRKYSNFSVSFDNFLSIPLFLYRNIIALKDNEKYS